MPYFNLELFLVILLTILAKLIFVATMQVFVFRSVKLVFYLDFTFFLFCLSINPGSVLAKIREL